MMSEGVFWGSGIQLHTWSGSFFVDKSEVIHMAGVWVSFEVAAWVRLVVDKVAAWVRPLLIKWPHGCGS